MENNNTGRLTTKAINQVIKFAHGEAELDSAYEVRTQLNKDYYYMVSIQVAIAFYKGVPLADITEMLPSSTRYTEYEGTFYAS